MQEYVVMKLKENRFFKGIHSVVSWNQFYFVETVNYTTC